MGSSKQFTLNKEDLLKIGKGALIAMAGVLLTYLSTVVTQTDFGTWTPLVTAGWAVVVNTATKFLSDCTDGDYSKEKPVISAVPTDDNNP